MWCITPRYTRPVLQPTTITFHLKQKKPQFFDVQWWRRLQLWPKKVRENDIFPVPVNSLDTFLPNLLKSLKNPRMVDQLHTENVFHHGQCRKARQHRCNLNKVLFLCAKFHYEIHKCCLHISLLILWQRLYGEPSLQRTLLCNERKSRFRFGVH